MADFTVVASEALNTGGVTSQDTVSVTPQVGDVMFVALDGYTGSDLQVNGTGMTWAKIASGEITFATDSIVTSFVCTASDATAGAQTIEDGASANFFDTCYVIVRPVDLDSESAVGTATGTTASITATLTTSSPAALLGYGYHRGSTVTTFTADSGWAEILDEGTASSGAHTLQERFSDDAEWILTADIGGGNPRAAVVLQFSAAATGSGARKLAGRGGGLVGTGGLAGRGGGLVSRGMEKINGIWRPRLWPVGLDLRGV